MVLNKHSQTITQDPSQPGSQAQLYALGLSEEDLKNPLFPNVDGIQLVIPKNKFY